MSNNIPKEWANQRPRNMAHAPKRKSADPFDVPVKIGVGFAVALVCVSILAVMLYGLGSASDRRQNAVVAADKVSITPILIDTNTPTPTETPEPAHTQRPTKTAQPTKTQRPEVLTVIETVIVEVRVTVERVITATAQPWTASPTADAMQILREAQARKSAADIEIQIRKENASMKRAEFFGSPAFITAAAILVVICIFGARINAKWSKRPTEDRTNQTAEEITNAYTSASNDIRDLIRASIAIYGPGGKRIAGWRDLDGWTGDRWDTAVKALRLRGVGIYTQPGEGTFLTRYDLRTALMLMYPPSPTEPPNKNAVQNSEQDDEHD